MLALQRLVFSIPLLPYKCIHTASTSIGDKWWLSWIQFIIFPPDKKLAGKPFIVASRGIFCGEQVMA